MDQKSFFLALVIFISIFVGCSSDRVSQDLESGLEFYAIDPSNIVDIHYTSPTYKFYATRWSSAQDFSITFVSSSTIEHCLGGVRFRKWLQDVSRIVVRGKVYPAPAAETVEVAEMRLNDVSDVGGIDVHLLVPLADSSPVMIDHQSGRYAVDLDAAALRAASFGCQAFARRDVESTSRAT